MKGEYTNHPGAIKEAKFKLVSHWARKNLRRNSIIFVANK
jgi:hypothetical protein